MTAKLIGEVGDVSRFRSADAFSMRAGCGAHPGELGAGQPAAPQPGRQPPAQSGLYSIALAQARSYPPAQAFIARKRAEGKSWREAIRALKRHLAQILFRLLSLPITQVSSLRA